MAACSAGRSTSGARPAISVLGSANVDLVTRVARMPRPGETVRGIELCQYPGGKGANQAVAASRLDAAVAFFGKVGADGFGDELLDALRADGVDVAGVERADGVATGTASIWVDAAGENAIACVAGANGAVDGAYVERTLDRLAAADVVLVQFEIPIAAVSRLLERLPRGRPLVVLDPAPAGDVFALPLERVDVLTPNETELEALTGLADPERAARHLLERGVGLVVLKEGARGATAYGDETVHVAAFDVCVVDTTAAGDAFTAALAVALGEWPLRQALHFANAAGALATTQPGAQPSLPTRDAVEALLGRSLRRKP
ncbi:MAG: ribokinase [Candidatus Bipolaricaulota bacterium]